MDESEMPLQVRYVPRVAGSVSNAFASSAAVSRGYFLLIHSVEIDRLQKERWEATVSNEVVYMLTHERE